MPSNGSLFLNRQCHRRQTNRADIPTTRETPFSGKCPLMSKTWVTFRFVKKKNTTVRSPVAKRLSRCKYRSHATTTAGSAAPSRTQTSSLHENITNNRRYNSLHGYSKDSCGARHALFANHFVPASLVDVVGTREHVRLRMTGRVVQILSPQFNAPVFFVFLVTKPRPNHVTFRHWCLFGAL